MKTHVYFFSLLLSATVVAQPDSNAQHMKQFAPVENVYVEFGGLSPMGTLREYQKASANFGFWAVAKRFANEQLEAGFNLTLAKPGKAFTSQKFDSIFSNRAKAVSGMIGLRYARRYPMGKGGSWTAEVFPSLGYGFFGYESQLKSTQSDGQIPDGERKFKALSTIHVGQGFRINYKNVGLQAQYQFTPYDWFSRNDETIGAHSLTFGIVYRQ
ncbi:hypothetical protein FLLO111716_11620 [Flavobacterium longum]|uniref:hypothetical protein n=1 Tax=Flavobacterium longum TaxID=1299340 RepID=UPI0039E75C8D